LVVVMIGTFMGPFDGSVVNIALPRLTEYFQVPVTTVEWVVVAYLLTISTFLFTFGRLGDMLGLKRVYLAGFFVFVGGSLACSLAPNVWVLVWARVAQAVGAGMLFAMGPAIVTKNVPPQQRGQALGYVGISVAAGLAVGPTLGGLIIGALDWRWIFLVNLPVGLVAGLLAYRVLPPDTRTKQRFDPAGAAFSFLTLFPLLLALSKGETWGWGTPLVIGLVVTSLLGGAAFIYTETHVAQPLLDLDLFRNRLFSAATASAAASYMVIATVVFIMPFYLIQVRGFPVEKAGLLLTPLPLMTALVGPFAGGLSDRIGSRVLSTTGMLVSLIGVLLLTTLSQTTPMWGVALRVGILGLGMGLFSSPNTSAIMGSVSRARIGIASGTVATARNVGQVMGVSMAGMVLAVREPVYIARLAATVTPEAASKAAFLSAAHDAAWVAAGVCVLGILASLVRGSGAAARGAAGHT
jgi:EmrB/QacA subfamily drug resistance transporter